MPGQNPPIQCLAGTNLCFWVPNDVGEMVVGDKMGRKKPARVLAQSRTREVRPGLDASPATQLRVLLSKLRTRGKMPRA